MMYGYNLILWQLKKLPGNQTFNEVTYLKEIDVSVSKIVKQDLFIIFSE